MLDYLCDLSSNFICSKVGCLSRFILKDGHDICRWQYADAWDFLSYTLINLLAGVSSECLKRCVTLYAIFIGQTPVQLGFVCSDDISWIFSTSLLEISCWLGLSLKITTLKLWDLNAIRILCWKFLKVKFWRGPYFPKINFVHWNLDQQNQMHAKIYEMF